MSEERLEQVEQKLDSLISAIQTGFGNFERQLNDSRSDNRQLSTQLNDLRGDNRQISTDIQQVSSQLKKIEERVQIIDSRINTIDLRLAGMSNDILGLQTEQNRIKEYLFNRPQ
jgi:chromosome segregation ATPase